MARLLAIIALALAAQSCRKDPADLVDLKWTCARVPQHGTPTATPACLDELHRTSAAVFKYYAAVPKLRDGKAESYELIER